MDFEYTKRYTVFDEPLPLTDLKTDNFYATQSIGIGETSSTYELNVLGDARITGILSAANVVIDYVDAKTANIGVATVGILSAKSSFVSGISTATTFVGAGTIPVGGIIMWSGTIAAIPLGWALCDGLNGTPDLRNQFIIGASIDSGGQSTTTVTGVSIKSGGSKDVTSTYTHSHTVNGGSSSASFLTSASSVATNSATISYSGGLSQATFLTSASLNPISGNLSIDSTGSLGTNENLPPYFALAFIMRTA